MFCVRCTDVCEDPNNAFQGQGWSAIQRFKYGLLEYSVVNTHTMCCRSQHGATRNGIQIHPSASDLGPVAISQLGLPHRDTINTLGKRPPREHICFSSCHLDSGFFSLSPCNQWEGRNHPVSSASRIMAFHCITVVDYCCFGHFFLKCVGGGGTRAPTGIQMLNQRPPVYLCTIKSSMCEIGKLRPRGKLDPATRSAFHKGTELFVTSSVYIKPGTVICLIG